MVIINPSTNGSVNGIITYFYRNYRSVYKALVTATGSSTYRVNNWGYPDVLLNRDNPHTTDSQIWCSDYRYKDPFYQLSFPLHPIKLKSYTLSAFNYYNYLFHAWTVEGSNNSYEWSTIDTKTEQNNENVEGIIKTCECDTVAIYKYFRFNMTGTNNEGNYHFILRNIEIFGEIMFSLKKNTCKIHHSNSFISLCLICLMYK